MESPNPSHLVFDLETVPDTSLYTPPETEPDRPPPMAPIYAQQVIVVGALWLEQDHSFKRLWAMGPSGAEEAAGDAPDELTLLKELVDFVEEHRPTLVTFCGRGFDLPVLTLRCLHHGLAVPWLYDEQAGYLKRRGDTHLDLLDLLAHHGAARYTSLDAASRLIGLPGKFEGVDGSKVEGLFRAGELERIQRYCLSDVVQTGFLLLRFQLLRGALTSGYRQAALRLLRALKQDGQVEALLERCDRERLLLGTTRTSGHPTTPRD
jgi:predicted PolB exonuclease-like 3'-5' exonuclease